ncbi:ATP-dependent endonuclease [Catenulispora sp. MAP12-49]|uniref:ATP-dependent nuclease n=1 Tax=Catenulispora sp. MAP12-49 TaxID=3156302 RepID=UPI0035163005
MNQQWERDLVWLFVRASCAYGTQPEDAEENTPEVLDGFARAVLDEDSISVLHDGALRVQYDERQPMPWSAVWEFGVDFERWQIGLVGNNAGHIRLCSGTKAFSQQRRVRSFTQALYAAVDTRVGSNGSLDGAYYKRSISFEHALPSAIESIDFDVSTATDASLPRAASRQELAHQLGVTDADNRIFGFVHVMEAILRRGIVLTENRRLPARSDFALQELTSGPVDLRDGSAVAAELFRLKNGSAVEQRQYERLVELYAKLTSCQLGLRTRPIDSEGSADLRIEPTVVSDQGEIPVSFSGTGREEALVLATLLSREYGRLLVLDEPAVNLEPTMQRRLITALRDAGQVLVITHNPDMVPIDGVDDLEKITRLAPTVDGVEVRRAPSLKADEKLGWRKLLEPTHVRGLLFAAGVILCEGQTETGALPEWWRDTSTVGLPDPEAAHIPIISVGGDKAFGSYCSYLDAFGVPWAIIADGPALRGDSVLAKQLAGRGQGLPAGPPSDRDDFEAWRDYWREVGVFTLADRFGDDGTKAGEFEAFLGRVDQAIYDNAKAIGGRSKPRVGACFAIEHPTPPSGILDLYVRIMSVLSQKSSSSRSVASLRS